MDLKRELCPDIIPINAFRGQPILLTETMPGRRLIRMRKTVELRDGLYDLASKVIERIGKREGPQRDLAAIEVGSFAGESTAILSDVFDRVISVDPHKPYPKDKAGDARQLKMAKRELCNLICSRDNISYLQMPSADASSLLGAYCQSEIDLVYIDAKHDYVSVQKDISIWKNASRFIGGHDYDKRFPGVVRAVDEYAKAIEKEWSLTQDNGKNSVCEVHAFKDGSWLIDAKFPA